MEEEDSLVAGLRAMLETELAAEPEPRAGSRQVLVLLNLMSNLISLLRPYRSKVSATSNLSIPQCSVWNV